MANGSRDCAGDHIYSNIMGPEPSYKWKYMSNEKNLVGRGIEGIILPSSIGSIVNHYKDFY